MNEKIRFWMEQRAAALAQARAILDGAYAENRDLNADEQQKYDGFNAEYDSLTAKINREQALADREADLTRSANGEQNPNRSQQPGRVGDGQRAETTDSAEYRRSLLRYMAYGVQDAVLRTDVHGSEMRDILGVSLGGAGATGGVLAPGAMGARAARRGKKAERGPSACGCAVLRVRCGDSLCDRAHAGVSGRRGCAVHRVDAGLR
jgi:HK97 family phage major capsid protein